MSLNFGQTWMSGKMFLEGCLVFDQTKPLVTVSGSAPTPWSGPFRDHGLRPWSQSPSEHRKTLEIKGYLGLERPFLDLVSQTPRPRGRGRPLFADLGTSARLVEAFLDMLVEAAKILKR